MKKVFGMATIPQRIKTLQKVLNTVNKQVDYGYVIFNNYIEVPGFMKNYPNITSILNKKGKLRDGAKYIPLALLKEDVYYYSCDDDIFYPKTYFEYMKNRCDELNAIVTQHGKRFKKFPIEEYYKDTTCFNTHFKDIRKEDVLVPFGGTGVMCFNTKLFNIKNTDFIKEELSADIWVGIEAFKKCIQIFCIKTYKNVECITYEYNIFSHLNKKESNINKKQVKDRIREEINKTFIERER